MVSSNVLLGISLFPLSEDVYPSAVWTMMSVLQQVCINLEDLASDTSSSTWMKENLLSWFLNVVKNNFKISRGGVFLLGIKKIGMI